MEARAALLAAPGRAGRGGPGLAGGGRAVAQLKRRSDAAAAALEKMLELAPDNRLAFEQLRIARRSR